MSFIKLFSKQTQIFKHESFVFDCLFEIESNLIVLYFFVRIKMYKNKVFPNQQLKLSFHLYNVSKFVLKCTTFIFNIFIYVFIE